MLGLKCEIKYLGSDYMIDLAYTHAYNFEYGFISSIGYL